MKTRANATLLGLFVVAGLVLLGAGIVADRKSTRLNSSHRP